MNPFDPNRHGEASQTGTPALREGWRMAEEYAVRRPGPGRWVPWRAVWVKDGVSPRRTDYETVELYRQSFFDLPPIRVQKGTFALIDGLHRLEAAPRASSECIRVVEEDIPDDRLAVEAFLANVHHGRAYTTAERIQGLKLLIARDMFETDAEYVRAVGVNRETVAKYRGRARENIRIPDSSREPQYVENQHFTSHASEKSESEGEKTGARDIRTAHTGKQIGTFPVGATVRDLATGRQAVIIAHEGEYTEIEDPEEWLRRKVRSAGDARWEIAEDAPPYTWTEPSPKAVAEAVDGLEMADAVADTPEPVLEAPAASEWPTLAQEAFRDIVEALEVIEQTPIRPEEFVEELAKLPAARAADLQVTLTNVEWFTGEVLERAEFVL